MTRRAPLIIFISIVIIFFFSCGKESAYEGFSDGPDGVFYKLHTMGETENKLSSGDYVFLKAVFKTGKDSVFWDSRYNAAKNYFFKVTDKKLNSPFLGFLFTKYSEGDSLTFKVHKTIFFRDVFDTIVPWFMSSDSIVTANVMIERVLSENEFAKYWENGDLRIEAEQWQQKKSIEEWVLANFQNAVKADSLLYYEKLVSSSDTMVRAGKTVTVCYKGCFLDGKVFDEANPVTINYGYEGQMLRGIEKVIGRLRRGESAKIIIPSHLGFGEYGSSNGSVPPNTPIVYEVKILDIK